VFESFMGNTADKTHHMKSASKILVQLRWFLSVPASLPCSSGL